MSAYLQGIQGAFDNQAQIKNDISVVAINWFVNRCPLVTRVPRVPVGSTTFNILSRSYRKRTAVLASAIASGSATSITLDDASPFMNGDVLEVVKNDGTAKERIEITGDPNVATNVITVLRAQDGTTGVTNDLSGNTTVTLIGNSRTGAEIDQNAAAFKPVAVPQYCQTFQHPVQVGGSLQASTAYQTQPGVSTPFDQDKMDALQNIMDDMEVSAYLGKGNAPSSGNRPRMKGVRSLVSNLVTSPTNASAYKPTDLIRDLLQAPRKAGGDPDVLILSTEFMTGLATWGHNAQRVEAGSNVFGTPISTFEAPFLGGLTIIEAPLLPSYSAISLTSAEVRMRMKRNEFWSPRGNRGDAIEGDWIAEGAIELDNPGHHAWVEGITAFSAT